METRKNNLLKEIKDLSDREKFDDIIELLSDERMKVIIEGKDTDNIAAELYVWKGYARHEQNDYDNAIVDYSEAIKLNHNYTLAFYNRAFAFIGKKEYNKAIEDCDMVINLNPDYIANAYVIKGTVLRAMKEYKQAIEYYDKAIDIDSNYANAYLNRGIAKKEYNVDLAGSRQDFDRFIELTENKNDKWIKYASYCIGEINELNDRELLVIIDIVAKIKKALLVNEDCITHYTSLSVLKSLILEGTEFRLSEGNCMNDPSEGKEFFNFLEYKPYTSCKDGLSSENFSPKPFIGSFVTKDKYDDLNMWRFYGKEEGIEAKGCAITLCADEFIRDINNSLPKGEEDYLKTESDIHFYWVVYLETGTNNFHIPSLNNSEELERLMTELKEKVKSYSIKDKISLEKYLNSIAFLFKSDAYKNENEVRLVVKGIEFKKKYNMAVIPPRVYIELGSIKKMVKQITLGPKVDRVNEWASAFHYSYEVNAPVIIISHLPYR